VGGIFSAQALKMPPLKVPPIAAVASVFILQFTPQALLETLFARLRADILAAKGSFIIVIAPSALENFARLGLACYAPQALKMPPQTVSKGRSPLSPPWIRH